VKWIHTDVLKEDVMVISTLKGCSARRFVVVMRLTVFCGGGGASGGAGGGEG
jgi:hypothetical protein